MTTPKKRGRPSTSIQMIKGKSFITAETLEKEIENLEKHRKQCRERYRTKRDILKTLRPDLFGTRNGIRTNQQALRRYGIPIGDPIFQNTETTKDTSEAQGCTEIHSVTIREASNGPWTEISR
jgi:hypothetical protein